MATLGYRVNLMHSSQHDAQTYHALYIMLILETGEYNDIEMAVIVHHELQVTLLDNEKAN